MKPINTVATVSAALASLLAGVTLALASGTGDFLSTMANPAQAVCLSCETQRSIDGGPLVTLEVHRANMGATNVGTGLRTLYQLQTDSYVTNLAFHPRMYFVGARDVNSDGILQAGEYAVLAAATIANGGVTAWGTGVRSTIEGITVSAYQYPTMGIVTNDDVGGLHWDICSGEVLLNEAGIRDAELIAFISEYEADQGGLSVGGLVVSRLRAREVDAVKAGGDSAEMSAVLTSSGSTKLDADPVRDGMTVRLWNGTAARVLTIAPDSASWRGNGRRLAWKGADGSGALWRLALDRKTGRMTATSRGFDFPARPEGAMELTVAVGSATGSLRGELSLLKVRPHSTDIRASAP